MSASKSVLSAMEFGTVAVHSGVEVSARAVESVAAAAARAVPGVTALEPTLLGVANEFGKQVLGAVTGRDGAEAGDGVAVRIDDGRVRVEVCLALGGRSAREVCADVSRTVRAEVLSRLGVPLAAVRTTVVEVAALPIVDWASDEVTEGAR